LRRSFFLALSKEHDPKSTGVSKSGRKCSPIFPLFFQLDPVGAGHPKPRVFSYNVVFEPGATQEDVLQFSGIKRLIEMAVEGFSTTAFCYGQTGSGKTHTLTGPPGLVSSLTNITPNNDCVTLFLADI